MNALSPLVLRFGIFELDLKTGELHKSGRLVNLPPQPSRILGLLAIHPGQLVTRDEIKEEIWGTETFVDFDKGLNFAIQKIRAALGDSADAPRYIETLPRRGYRFIAAVQVVTSHGATSTSKVSVHPAKSSAAGADLSSNKLAEHASVDLGGMRRRELKPLEFTAGLSPSQQAITMPASHPLRLRTVNRALAWTAGFLGLASIVLTVLLAGSGPRPSTLAQIHSLTLLPLENLLGQEKEYFADGMTEEIITDLEKIEEVRISSWDSVKAYKGMNKDVQEIGREQHADGVLQGTLSLSGNGFRITMRLIPVNPKMQPWEQAYDCEETRIFALPGKLAQGIADKIKIKLSQEVTLGFSSDHPSKPEAYGAYLKGRNEWNKRTTKSLRQSVKYFNEAIAEDPNYVQALVGRAEAYALFSDYEIPAPSDSYLQAKADALQALNRDKKLGEAYAALGKVEQEYERKWFDAGEHFKTAIQYSPGSATVHQWYSEYLVRMGCHEEALNQIQLAQQLDPLSPIINAEVGAVYYWNRRYPDAIKQLQKTLEKDPPDLEYAHSWLGFAYEQAGIKQETVEEKMLMQRAIVEFNKAVDSSGSKPGFNAALAHAYGLSGNKHEGKKRVEKLEAMWRQGNVVAYDIAVAYTGLGDKEKALEWLEQALQDGDAGLDMLKIEPAFDSLRLERRFTMLIRRVGLSVDKCAL